jgi:predicted DNA-binding transcriptional regulator YafY
MSPFDVQLQERSGVGNGVRDKVIRLLRMAWLLQQEDCTLDHLSARFSVSRRTIYRDLRLIDQADLPLVTRRSGRGYRLIRSRMPLEIEDPASRHQWL